MADDVSEKDWSDSRNTSGKKMKSLKKTKLFFLSKEILLVTRWRSSSWKFKDKEDQTYQVDLVHHIWLSLQVARNVFAPIGRFVCFCQDFDIVWCWFIVLLDLTSSPCWFILFFSDNIFSWSCFSLVLVFSSFSVCFFNFGFILFLLGFHHFRSLKKFIVGLLLPPTFLHLGPHLAPIATEWTSQNGLSRKVDNYLSVSISGGTKVHVEQKGSEWQVCELEEEVSPFSGTLLPLGDPRSPLKRRGWNSHSLAFTLPCGAWVVQDASQPFRFLLLFLFLSHRSLFQNWSWCFLFPWFVQDLARCQAGAEAICLSCLSVFAWALWSSFAPWLFLVVEIW